MGVRGLQSFLKNNQQLLSDSILLTNTHLVIDSNNLLISLFATLVMDRQSPYFRSDIYSGDLIAYGNVVRDFFKTLDKCQIIPILVFDGSVIGREELKDFIATKEAETHRRGLQRFQAALKLTEANALVGNDSESLFLPQQLNIVFRNITNELGVQRIQTPYEADNQIARIANDLECYVLTNDSDFLIYNLKKGFILIDRFYYKKPIVNQKGETCIECVAFSQDKLIQKIKGLRKENLPLLSVLLGNDYVEAGTFDPVTYSICNLPYYGNFQVVSFNHRRIANLLLWLCQRSLQEAIDHILNLVNHTHRPKLEKCIRMFLKNYKIEETEDFDKELERIYPECKVASNAAPYQSPAKFIRLKLENDCLTGSALDIVFKNTHYNYSVLDDLNLPSASTPMFRPYSLGLVLLRPNPYTNLTTYQRKIQSDKDSFKIYDRVKTEYTKLIIQPMEKLEHFGTLEHLDCYSMILLEPALKKNILMETFRFNADEFHLMSETLGLVLKEPAISEASLCFLLVKYIALETGVKPKSQFVNALMMTHFYHAALGSLLNLSAISDEAFGKLLLRLRPHSITNNNITYKDEPILYRRITHLLNQLQSTYNGFNLVNSLLNRVFSPPRHDRWFNGPLIFRMTKLLILRQETLENLCQDIGVLLDVCQSINVQIHTDD